LAELKPFQKMEEIGRAQLTARSVDGREIELVQRPYGRRRTPMGVAIVTADAGVFYGKVAFGQQTERNMVIR
jgi:hypothetical protein